MASTTAIQAKEALHSLIVSLPAAVEEKWDTTWGFDKAPERTWVYAGGITWDSSEWVTNRSREEAYRLKVVINIKRRRATPEDCEREVMRISSLIEAAVKAAPNLGMPEIVIADFVPRSMDSWPADDMCEAQAEADIRITARF